MTTPFVEEYLSAYLQGHRSADDTRQILRLIDGSERNDGPLEVEFDNVLSRVSKKIPGLTLDFEKLLTGDPIECDPLISQGNLAILRLDNIFRQAYTAWMNSGAALHTIKRIAKPEDSAKYSDRTQQHIRTEETYPPDAQLLNQVVNITLSGFRIQATITHRREQLKKGPQTDEPVSRDATRSAFSPQQSPSQSQPEASARAAAQSSPLSETDPDIIDHNEFLNSDFDDLSKPIDGNAIALIRGVNKISGLKGYNPIEPLISPKRKRENAEPSSTEPADQTEPDDAKAASQPRKEEPVTTNIAEPPPPSIHPQYTPPGFAWQNIFPPGMDQDDEEAEDKPTPTYSKPPFPGEKTHYYPPFAPASEEDANEIEAYLSTLPEELRTSTTIGTVNDYLEAPLWRETETEHDWLKKHTKIHREREKSARVAFRSAKERNTTDKAQPPSPDCNGVANSDNGAPYSDCGTPRSEHAESANNASLEPREAEPVTLEFSAPSASPRETHSFTRDEPAYHKRE